MLIEVYLAAQEFSCVANVNVHLINECLSCLEWQLVSKPLDEFYLNIISVNIRVEIKYKCFYYALVVAKSGPGPNISCGHVLVVIAARERRFQRFRTRSRILKL